MTMSMKHLFLLPLVSMAALFVTSCANNGSDSGLADNTGPFDEHGNYRDDWADDPTKWRRPGGSKPSTKIASNDLPPADASPIASYTPPAPRSTSSSSSSSSSARTQSAPKPKPAVAYKPKAKPKPKPTSTRYTVKKGDSLYAIAQRNRTSVSALQKANNISGSLIRPGQNLVIPKR